MNITVLGIGAFGYALLRHIDRENPDITLTAWDIRPEIIQELQDNHCLIAMKDQGSLSSRVVLTQEISTAVTESDIIILSVASVGLESVLRDIKPYLKPDVNIVNVAKALDERGRRVSQLVEETLAPFYGHFGVLSGATRADDVLHQRFVAASFGSEHAPLLETMKVVLSRPQFKLETTLDVEAVEIAGISKNLLTLLYGYLKGYGFSETQAGYVLATTMFQIEERYPVLRDQSLLPAWNVDIWMSAHTGTRNVTCGIHLGRRDADPSHHMQKIGTSEGWKTLKILPLNKELYSIPAFGSLYQLLISKDLDHSQWQTVLTI
jgi:glycerol-3-phosphate dehydrogenase